MPKKNGQLYAIWWDIGFGRIDETVEADSHDEAVSIAYEAAREDFESQAGYGASLAGYEEDED